jgi:hypothetical protein
MGCSSKFRNNAATKSRFLSFNLVTLVTQGPFLLTSNEMIDALMRR